AQFQTGTASTVILTGGSGSVGIKFNTDADPEQVPLSTISVDWGEPGAPIDPIQFPYAPHNDPSQPHILSHPYVCNGGGSCTYEISIQVKDNWGWCNDASGSTQCQPQGSWKKTGLKVIVLP